MSVFKEKLKRVYDIAIVREFLALHEKSSEADPVALAIQFLVFFGSFVGDKITFKLGPNQTRANIYAIIVGKSSIGRKGTSYNNCKKFFDLVDPEFVKSYLRTGLSTYEGLVAEMKRSERKGTTLLIVQTEGAAVFQNFKRQGNKLSSAVRDMWDGSPLGVLAAGNNEYVEHHYLSCIFHITPTELIELLPKAEMSNGFANRFIWFYVERAAVLPFPEEMDQDRYSKLIDKVRASLEFSKQQTTMSLAADACLIWEEMYRNQSAEESHVKDLLKGRYLDQIQKMALMFALLEKSPEILKMHLLAAIELWNIAEGSIEIIFSTSSLTKLEKKILAGLAKQSDWISSTTLNSKILGNNREVSEKGAALQSLLNKGYMQRSLREGVGAKSVDLWKITEEGRKVVEGE